MGEGSHTCVPVSVSTGPAHATTSPGQVSRRPEARPTRTHLVDVDVPAILDDESQQLARGRGAHHRGIVVLVKRACLAANEEAVLLHLVRAATYGWLITDSHPARSLLHSDFVDSGVVI